MAADKAAIDRKIRLLTRSPHPSLLTTEQINNAIDTVMLYELPQLSRLNTLEVQLTWYTIPFNDTYETGTDLDINNPLYNFKNIYITANKPAYVQGYESYFTQSREEFYRIWPEIQTITFNTTGDDVTTQYIGSLQKDNIKGSVMFGATNDLGFGMEIVDRPRENDNLHGDLVDQLTQNIVGSITYATGAFDVEFTSPPLANTPVIGMSSQYSSSRPNMILYHNNVFKIRPIPDKVYPIKLHVYKRPSLLLEEGSIPDLEQWWQFIAYAGARIILQERMDM